MPLFAIDNSRPTVKDLYEKITPNFAVHWKTLGVFLGVPKGELDAIEYNFFRNCQECCNRMLVLWLDTDSNASWKNIHDAVNLAVRTFRKTSMSIYSYLAS